MNEFWKGYGVKPPFAEIYEDTLVELGVPDTEEAGRDALEWCQAHMREHQEEGKFTSPFVAFSDWTQWLNYKQQPLFKRVIYSAAVKAALAVEWFGRFIKRINR